MSTALKRFRRLGLLFSVFGWLSLLLVSIGSPAHAEERSFEISEVAIQAKIDGDGNLLVTEEDTYRFKGAFNGVVVELNTSGSDGLERFQAFEISGSQPVPLDFEQTADGTNRQIKIMAKSQDETKRFRWTYTLKNIVRVYADTAELYWKFFDETNPTKLGAVRVDVALPDQVKREDIIAFGHGPLHGTMNTGDDGVVRYEMSPLPAGELLEARILFPVSLVPGSTKVSAEPMRDRIREQEGKASASAEGDDTSVYGALALLAANLAAGVWIWARYTKAYKSEWTGDVYRELPSDVTPAVVSYLMNFRIEPRDLIATLVDLVRKQKVAIQSLKPSQKQRKQSNYRFRLTDPNPEGLLPHETRLLDWFFGEIGDGQTVSLSEIRRHAAGKAGTGEFRDRWSDWKNEVIEAACSLDYIRQMSRASWFVILAVVVQFFGFWFLAPEDWRWLMFCALPLLLFKPKKQRRTQLGQTEYVKWQAFKRYLREYAQTNPRDPVDIRIWDRYLVYAIPLGEAKPLNGITRMRVSSPSDTDSLYGYIWPHVDYWVESFERTVAASGPSASSADSSGDSSSSSDGDSGGGGGRGAF